MMICCEGFLQANLVLMIGKNFSKIGKYFWLLLIELDVKFHDHAVNANAWAERAEI